MKKIRDYYVPPNDSRFIEYLNQSGYRSRRGKRFYGSLVERIYKKYLKKIENEMIRNIEIREES